MKNEKFPRDQGTCIIQQLDMFKMLDLSCFWRGRRVAKYGKGRGGERGRREEEGGGGNWVA